MASLTNHAEARKSGLAKPPDDRAGYPSHKAIIEDYLKDLSFSRDPRLAKLVGAMRYCLSVEDKRARAVLCMEVARSFGSDPVQVLPSAAAIELLHTGSLVHGSLPAVGKNHRGPMRACYERFGEATAILAGDAFFSEALILVSARQNGTSKQIFEIIRNLAGATGANGMVGGCVLDTVDGAEQPADPETLKIVHYHRTGPLIEASARVGAILAGASAKEKEDISEYARQLSLCLCIVEDLRKANLALEESRKGISSSADHETSSFVRVYGLPRAQRLADEALHEALAVLGRLDRDTRGLRQMARLVRSGSD